VSGYERMLTRQNHVDVQKALTRCRGHDERGRDRSKLIQRQSRRPKTFFRVIRIQVTIYFHRKATRIYKQNKKEKSDCFLRQGCTLSRAVSRSMKAQNGHSKAKEMCHGNSWSCHEHTPLLGTAIGCSNNLMRHLPSDVEGDEAQIVDLFLCGGKGLRGRS
jgi:hypothetical protein